MQAGREGNSTKQMHTRGTRRAQQLNSPEFHNKPVTNYVPNTSLWFTTFLLYDQHKQQQGPELETGLFNVQ